MKQITLIVVLMFIFPAISLGQTYVDQNRKCSEVLDGVPIGSDIFWNKLKLRDSCLIGIQVPPFEVTTLENEKFNVENLKGKVVVLNFWFTRCAPCIEEITFLNKIASKYNGNDMVFLAIANEDSLKLESFLKSTKFDFKVVPNGSNILLNTFKLFSAWPTTIIIDKNSKIRFIWQGKLDDESVNFEKTVAELLK